MYITFLKFSDNKASAPDFMSGHNEWLAKGFDDGVFVTMGTLNPAAGGVIFAKGEDRAAYDARIASDPFVVEGVVIPETHEVEARRTIAGLEWLKDSV